MKSEQHAIQPLAILEGMTASDRTLLWRALTFDQMPNYLKHDDDTLCLYIHKRGGQYVIDIERMDKNENFEAVLSWRREPLKTIEA
jgi:hypothetical protein